MSDAEKINKAYILDAYDYIDDFYNEYYKPLFRIYKMQTPEYWTRMLTWGDCDDFKEIIIFKKNFTRVEKKLKSIQRPDLFKVTKVRKILKELRKRQEREQQLQREKEAFERAARGENLKID